VFPSRLHCDSAVTGSCLVSISTKKVSEAFVNEKSGELGYWGNAGYDKTHSKLNHTVTVLVFAGWRHLTQQTYWHAMFGILATVRSLVPYERTRKIKEMMLAKQALIESAKQMSERAPI
jgi:hypothetical protein